MKSMTPAEFAQWRKDNNWQPYKYETRRCVRCGHDYTEVTFATLDAKVCTTCIGERKRNQLKKDYRKKAGK